MEKLMIIKFVRKFIYLGWLKNLLTLDIASMVKMSFKLTRSCQAVLLYKHTCIMCSFSTFSRQKKI